MHILSNIAFANYFQATFANCHDLCKTFRAVVPFAFLQQNGVTLIAPRKMKRKFWVRRLTRLVKTEPFSTLKM